VGGALLASKLDSGANSCLSIRVVNIGYKRVGSGVGSIVKVAC